MWDNRFHITNLPDGYAVGALGEAGWRHVKHRIDVDNTLPKTLFRSLPALFARTDLEVPVFVPHISHVDVTHPINSVQMTFINELHL